MLLVSRYYQLALPVGFLRVCKCFRSSPLCCPGSPDGSVWGWRAAAAAVRSQQFSLWGERAKQDSYSHTEVCEEACGSSTESFKYTATNKQMESQVVSYRAVFVLQIHK